MSTALWKVAPLAVVLLLPAVSRASAADDPGGQDGQEIVMDDGQAIATDDDEPLIGDRIRERREGFLGVRLIDITQELRAYFGAPRDAGVLVASVEPESPAAKSGIAVGDIIVKLDGEPAESSRDVSRLLRRTRKGESVKIEVERGKSMKTLTVAVAERLGHEIELGDLARRLGGRAWVMRGLPPLHIERPENLDRLQEKLDDLEKRLNDLEKKVR